MISDHQAPEVLFAGFEIFIGLWLLFIFLRFLARLGEDNNAGGMSLQPFHITIDPSDLELESGETLKVRNVKAHGQITVPRDQTPCLFRVGVLDETEGSGFPVLCHVEALRNEHGFFYYEESLTIPHQQSIIGDYPIVIVPTEALIAPRRGRRRMQVWTVLCSADGNETVYAHATRTFIFDQETYGFLELSVRDREVDKAVAELGLAVCASDGHIDKRELAVMKEFLAERLASDEEEDEERKEELNQAMKSELKRVKERLAAGQPIQTERPCETLRSQDNPALLQVVYELCLRIVAADGVVDEGEQRALKKISAQLGLEPDLERALRDRHLRLSMYDEQNADQAIILPADATPKQKRKLLKAEYKKWKRRVTSNDPEVAKEAEERIEMITSMLHELDQQG